MASYRFLGYSRVQGKSGRVYFTDKGQIIHNLPEGEFPESIAEDITADYAPPKPQKKRKKKIAGKKAELSLENQDNKEER